MFRKTLITLGIAAALWVSPAGAVFFDLHVVGQWNPNANDRGLKSGRGQYGDSYIVSQSGTFNLDGQSQWNAGDIVYFGLNDKWNRILGSSSDSATNANAITAGTLRPFINLIFPTHAALVAAVTTGTFDGLPLTIQQQGYYEAGDGGAATYDYKPSSADLIDGIYTILPAAQSSGVFGRYILRVPAEGLHPEVGGAKGDGSTDDGPALRAISATLDTVGGGTIVGLPGRLYNIASNTTLGMHVALKCPGNPMATAADNAPWTGIAHPPGVTFGTGFDSRVEGCVVWRTGLAAKPANTTALDTALTAWNTETSAGITIQGNDAQIENVNIIGFNTCLSSEGMSRMKIHNVKVDCANGAHFGGVHDTSLVDDVHANNTYASNLDGRIYGLPTGVATGGSGYTGTSAILPIIGGTCTRQPSVNATISGGVITTVAQSDVGDCSVPPASPVTLSGGGGSGATINMKWRTTSWRPGIGLDVDGTTQSIEGFHAFRPRFEGFQTCVRIKNAFDVVVDTPICEGDPSAAYTDHQNGILTDQCTTQVMLINPYVQKADIDLYMNHKSKADGGNCGALVGTGDASVTVIGGALGDDAGANLMAYFGPYSKGTMVDTQVGGTGAMLEDAAAGAWTFANLQAHDGYDFAANLLAHVNAAATITLPGILKVVGLPTSAPTLSGQIWRDPAAANVLKQVP